MSRRGQLQAPRSEKEFRAALFWMSEQGDKEDLLLVREIRQQPPYPSPDIAGLLDLAEQEISERLNAGTMGMARPPATPTEEQVHRAKRLLAVRYLKLPADQAAERTRAMAGRMIPGPNPLHNVQGVGIGEKVVGRRRLSGVLCVRVYVRKKYPESDIEEAHRIPREIAGVLTDVQEVGRIRAWGIPPCGGEARFRRQRAARCGVSVAHHAYTAGTLGAVVRDAADRRYILGANHVLALCNRANLGDAICQPGPYDRVLSARGLTVTDDLGDAICQPDPYDSGGMADGIARLSRFVEIDFDPDAENTVDCAIAELNIDEDVLAEICVLGPVVGRIEPARKMAVWKYGRTTGLTEGEIVDTDIEGSLLYHHGDVGWRTAYFVNLVAVEGRTAGQPSGQPFSEEGDSGALLLTDSRHACGMLIGGGDSSLAGFAFATPIAPVLDQLGVELV